MASTGEGFSHRQTDIPTIYTVPPPDYPEDDNVSPSILAMNQSQTTNESDSGTNSSGYSIAGPIQNNRQGSTQDTGNSQYDNDFSNYHTDESMIGPAIFFDPSHPTGNGHRMARSQQRGYSKISKHSYVDVDFYKHQTEDNLKSKGNCVKFSKVVRIFLITVIIAGLALMLTYLANDQRKIDDLNKNVQAQTSSLWSEQSKDSGDFNNTLIKFTEDQREDDEIMSILINDTQKQLEKISHVTNISLSLSKKSQRSFKVMTYLVEDLSSQTNSSMNEIGNRVDALSSEIQISSNNITNTMETISNHTKTTSLELKNMLKEQSNQSNTFLEEKMKELLKDLKDELTALIESRIGGGCINNSLNVTTGECVDSCLRVADGDYQSCDTCHGYVTCANNYNFTMKCPETYLIWDDNKKTCESTSETCNPNDFT